MKQNVAENDLILSLKHNFLKIASYLNFILLRVPKLEVPEPDSSQ